MLPAALQVEVRREDIERGERHSWLRNPISVAVRRQLGGSGHVFVDWRSITVHHRRVQVECTRTYRFEEAVGAWLRRYDRGDPVEPITFKAIARPPASAVAGREI